MTQLTEDLVHGCIRRRGWAETHDIVDELSKDFTEMGEAAIKKQVLGHLKNLYNEGKITKSKHTVQRKTRFGPYRIEADVWALPGALPEKQMPSGITVREQGVPYLIAVDSPITRLRPEKVYEFHLVNIKTLHEYLEHIPIEIQNLSNVSCQVWRIYLQRKRGIFGLSETIKAFLSGKYSSKDSLKLMVKEPLPIKVEPGQSIILHIPTNSILDVNREMEGGNVAIIVEHSYGISKSRNFSSLNFWLYNIAIKAEFNNHLARSLLQLSVTEGYGPNELKENIKKLTENQGLLRWTFLEHIQYIAESEKISLGLSDELVNEIKVENDEMTSRMKDLAMKIMDATFDKLNRKTNGDNGKDPDHSKIV